MHTPLQKLDPKKIFKGIAENRIFLNTINIDLFSHFSRYHYAAWIPPKARRDWITRCAQGEYLDIGCGSYPATMDIRNGQKRGVGVDISPEAARSYKKYFKDFYVFDIENIKLAEIPELHRKFDTVILSETLEHFRDPLGVLKKALTFLRHRGRILLTYPNAYSIAQYIDRATHRGRLCRFEEFHASHIYLVDKRTLEYLFHKAKLKIDYFDFRPSDFIEGFPRENSRIWKNIASIAPSIFGHQFFYMLSPKTSAIKKYA